jgi:hypothetical protein
MSGPSSSISPGPASISQQVRFLWLLGKLLHFACLADIRLIVSSFYRTADEQKALYQVGRRGIAGEKVITSCDGYERPSRHQSKTAIDLNIVNDSGARINASDLYEKLGLYWEGLGGTWGGHFAVPGPEVWHFDYRGEG